MSDHVEAYPLTWPMGRKRTPAGLRQPAAFKAERRSLTVGRAITRLRDEVSAYTRSGQDWVIRPSSVIVSCNVPTKGDGTPYASAREPDDPGVAVYFVLRGKRHCVSCDRWSKVADNIGAIAKHLEATRGIERWGTSDVEALFAGFKALPGGGAAEPIVTPAAVSVDDAAVFVAQQGNGTSPRSILHEPDAFRRAYRAAALKLHPDVNNSKTLPEWIKLQAAAEVLKRHHKL